MSPRVLVLVALALTLIPASHADAQVLRRASDTVRSSEPSRSSSRDDDDDSGSSSSASRDDDGGTLGRASSTVRGDGGGGRPRQRYAPRRWSYDVDVHFAYGAPVYVEPTPLDDAELQTMVVTQLEGSYVVDGVGRGTASVRVLLPVNAELFGGYSLYIEPRERGETDFVALGRLGAAWRAVDDEDFALRLGGSLRHWHDAEGARFGGEALAGIDMFPGDPFVLSLEGAIGVVGDAWVFEMRGTIGALLGPFEMYVGWHHVALEATNGTGGVELTGPIGGIRLWM